MSDPGPTQRAGAPASTEWAAAARTGIGDASPGAESPTRGAEAMGPTGGRLHWVDWLRVTAIAGVFVYHTLRPFNTAGWHVKNSETSELLNDATVFFGAFGLAALFLLAGAGVRFALRKRTWQAFLRERTTRLIVPFVAGTLLLSPIQSFIEATHTGRFEGSFVAYLPYWADELGAALGRGVSPTVFGIGYHLWFLGFLFTISVIALPACLWLRGPRGRTVIDAIARRARVPGATLTVVVPIYALMGLGSVLGTAEHDWFEFGWYLAYFLAGFLLVSDERFVAAVRRDLWPSLAAAIGVTALVVAGVPAPLSTAGQHGMGPVDLAIGAMFAALGWSWTLLILTVAMRLTAFQRPVAPALGDAVLPVYVIHQPVILAIAFFVVQWPLGILPKWLVVIGLAAVATFVVVELALRVPTVRILLGARGSTSVESAESASGRAVRPRPAIQRHAGADHGRAR